MSFAGTTMIVVLKPNLELAEVEKVIAEVTNKTGYAKPVELGDADRHVGRIRLKRPMAKLAT
jgi:hypothetical protein